MFETGKFDESRCGQVTEEDESPERPDQTTKWVSNRWLPTVTVRPGVGRPPLGDYLRNPQRNRVWLSLQRVADFLAMWRLIPGRQHQTSDPPNRLKMVPYMQNRRSSHHLRWCACRHFLASWAIPLCSAAKLRACSAAFCRLLKRASQCSNARKLAGCFDRPGSSISFFL